MPRLVKDRIMLCPLLKIEGVICDRVILAADP
jgi:hypothetical protein